MNFIETKLELIEWILRLDEKGLEKLLELKNNVDNGIIAYDAKGNPLTLEQYHANVNEATQDIKEGRVTSHEDFLKEIENW